MHKLVVLFGLFSSFGSFAQIDEVRRITKQLCAPEFHGRGYYAKGDSLAADFIVAEFGKLGIGSYKKTEMLQHYQLEGVNTFPGNARVVQDGRVLEPGIHFLLDPSSGGMKSALKPYLITLETAIDEEKLGVEIGKYMESSQYNGLLLDFAGAAGDTLKQIAGLAAAIAAYHPVIEIVNSKFTWSVGRNQLAFPLIRIQDSIIDRNASFEVNIDAELIQSYTTQNIIAHLPAKKKCAKTIVFTAHYDHLGRMGNDTYFPGANDNASGTAMLLTMAKYFKENPSKYNIMFIAFSGEEAGLVGSQYFTEHPVLPLKKIRFLVNLDIMGSGEEGITAVNATLFEKEFELLQEINTEKNLLHKVKKRGPAANSDHYWFTEKGVPAFFIYTMGPNKHYHDVFDEYEALSFVEYEDITTLLVTFVERLGKM
jgi:aminopeptidase YwaD